MKNKSILKNFIDEISSFVLLEINKMEEYNKQKKQEITSLDFIFREGPYYGFNVRDVIDIHPEYLIFYNNEGIFSFCPYIMDKAYNAAYGIV